MQLSIALVAVVLTGPALASLYNETSLNHSCVLRMLLTAQIRVSKSDFHCSQSRRCYPAPLGQTRRPFSSLALSKLRFS